MAGARLMEIIMRIFSAKQISAIAGLLVLGAAMWAGDAAHATAPPLEDGRSGAGLGGRDIYGVINLAPPTNFGGFINARGQAAFDIQSPDGLPHAAFFDGHRIIRINPPGDNRSFVEGLNEKGEVILRAWFTEGDDPTPTLIQPLRWTLARGLVPLQPLNPLETTDLADINNRGEIVGFSAVGDDNSTLRAVRWTSTNRRLVLPGPTSGFSELTANDINERNITVGSGIAAAGGYNALVWDASGRPTNLGTFGTTDAAAQFINDSGDIAGLTGFVDGVNGALFLWSPGRTAMRITNAYPRGLNEAGEVIGGRSVGNTSHAIRLTRARGLTDLHPARFNWSETFDLNDSGVIVGAAYPSLGDPGRAFRWLRSGVAVDLNTRLFSAPSGLVLHQAVRISANGDILALSNAGLVFLRRGGGTDAPVLGPIEPPDTLRQGEPAAFRLTFSDRNMRDTHTATVDWGDGSGPVPAVVRESNGRGEVDAVHTYASYGGYRVVVRITDSTRRSTTMEESVFVGDPLRAQLVGQGALQAGAATRAATAPFNARTSFRLAAPLALDGRPDTPFMFELLGRSAFKADRLDEVAKQGDQVRLAGSGKLDGRAGYRFVIDATVSVPGNHASASTISVRITPPAGAIRAPEADAVHAPGSLQAAPAWFTGTLQGGALRLVR
jgi:uncharacterized membrane protein